MAAVWLLESERYYMNPLAALFGEAKRGLSDEPFHKPSPWSRETPTDTGYYWLRDYSFCDSGEWSEARRGAVIVKVSAYAIYLIGDDCRAPLANVRGEWAKAEPPK